MSFNPPNPVALLIPLGFNQNPSGISRASKQFYASTLENLERQEADFFNDVFVLDQQQVFEKYQSVKKVLFYMWIIYRSSFTYWIYETDRRHVFIGLYESMIDADVNLASGLLLEPNMIDMSIFELPMAWLLNNGHRELVSKVVNKYQRTIKSDPDGVFILLTGIIDISSYRYIEEYSHDNDFYVYYYKSMIGGIYSEIYPSSYGYKELNESVVRYGTTIMIAYKNRCPVSQLTLDLAVNMLLKVAKWSFVDLSEGTEKIVNWNQDICDLFYELLTTLINDHIENAKAHKGTKHRRVSDKGLSPKLFNLYISGATEISLDEVKKAVVLYKRFIHEYMEKEGPNNAFNFDVKGIFPHTEETLIYLANEEIITLNQMVTIAASFCLHDLLNMYLVQGDNILVSRSGGESLLINGNISEDDALKTLNILKERVPGHLALYAKLLHPAVKFYLTGMIKPLIDANTSVSVVHFRNMHRWTNTNGYNKFIVEMYKYNLSEDAASIRTSFEYMYLRSKGVNLISYKYGYDKFQYPATIYLKYIYLKSYLIEELIDDEYAGELFYDTIKKILAE
jgi:hypothetical protein